MSGSVLAVVGGSPWAWEPRPDVWLAVAATGVGYWWSITRLRRRLPGPPARPSRALYSRFGLGLVVLWLAVDWPLDRLGDDFLFSAHMAQFVVVTMVAVPLMLTGTPPWLRIELVAPVAGPLRRLSRAPVALGLFQLVLVVTHLPVVVGLYTSSSLVHFALHAVWVVSAFLFWLPVFGDEQIVAPLRPAGRVAYLIAATIVPTVPASFLTWAERPYYDSYAQAPRVFGLSPLDDLQLAGLIMKLGGGFILWGFILSVFISWASQESHVRRKPPPASHDEPRLDGIETTVPST